MEIVSTVDASVRVEKRCQSTGGAFHQQYIDLQVNLQIDILLVEVCFAPLTPLW